MNIIKFTYGDNLEIISSEPVDYNTLDNTNKALLWKLLNTIKGNYDSIVLMITGTEAKKIDNDDVGVYWLGGKEKNDIF